MAGPGSLVRRIRDAQVAAAALAWLLAWGLLVGVVADQGRALLGPARDGLFGCRPGVLFLDQILRFSAVAVSPAGAPLLLLVIPAATLLPLALGARRLVTLYTSAAVAALALACVVSGLSIGLWWEAGGFTGPQAWMSFQTVALPGLLGVALAAGAVALGGWLRLTARLLRLRRGCLPAELGRATVIAAVPAVVVAIGAFLLPGTAVKLSASAGLLVPPTWAATGTLLPLAIGCALAVRLHRPRSMAA